MKNAVRNIIRKFINEIFDSHKLPDNYTEQNGVYYFENDGFKYYVKFEPFSTVGKYMVTDEKLFKVINESVNKFVVDFGIIENGEMKYNVKTNSNNPISLIKLVIGIIIKFCKENNVDVLSYVPNSDERDIVFNKALEKLLPNEYFRYRAKEMQAYNVFIISKKLL